MFLKRSSIMLCALLSTSLLSGMERFTNACARFVGTASGHLVSNAVCTASAVHVYTGFQLHKIATAPLLPLGQAIVLSSALTGLLSVCNGSGGFKHSVWVGAFASLWTIPLNIFYMRYLPLIR